MKRLILLMIAVIALASCNQTPQYLTPEEIAKYETSSYGQYVTSMEPDTTYISFYFDGIVDLIYYPEEKAYVVEYDDPDVFDYDYLYGLNQDSVTKNYVELEATEEVFKELMSDLDKTVVQRAYMENDWKWMIREVSIPSDCCIHYKYTLQKDVDYEP